MSPTVTSTAEPRRPGESGPRRRTQTAGHPPRRRRRYGRHDGRSLLGTTLNGYRRDHLAGGLLGGPLSGYRRGRGDGRLKAVQGTVSGTTDPQPDVQQVTGGLGVLVVGGPVGTAVRVGGMPADGTPHRQRRHLGETAAVTHRDPAEDRGIRVRHRVRTIFLIKGSLTVAHTVGEPDLCQAADVITKHEIVTQSFRFPTLRDEHHDGLRISRWQSPRPYLLR